MTLCGGGTLEEAMKFMFRMLFTDELLNVHCFKGQSRKRAFISYSPLLEAVVGKRLSTD